MVSTYMRGAVIPHFFFQGFPTTLSQRRGYTVPTLRDFIKVFSGYWKTECK